MLTWFLFWLKYKVSFQTRSLRGKYQSFPTFFGKLLWRMWSREYVYLTWATWLINMRKAINIFFERLLNASSTIIIFWSYNTIQGSLLWPSDHLRLITLYSCNVSVTVDDIHLSGLMFHVIEFSICLNICCKRTLLVK